MDYSKKVTAETGPDQSDGFSESQADIASSPLAEQLEETYSCPACPAVFSSSRDLSNHLRGHNSPRSTDCSGEDDYTCGICHKVLSSASSLDRHVLVHSGERPFKCKYCEIAFTTNGNMNRHLRTAHHGLSPSHSCTDSEGGSSDSEKISPRRHIEEEFNNNEIAKRQSPDYVEKQSQRNKRKCTDYDSDNRKAKIRLTNPRPEYIEYADQPNCFNCPVCRREFPTTIELEAHMDLKHYDMLNVRHYVDQQCNDSGRTDARNLRNSVIGFKDLTFTDFTSGLDLQNKAALNEAKEGKDLADIQSIISVTSGPILQSFGRSDVSTPDNCSTNKMSHHLSSSGSSGTPSSEYHEEENQDLMAAEFKKMKAKGEFPCRLCDKVCANLRALKGHNREHMSVAPGEPYSCSMCPAQCSDKAALTKHLRSHNGERPYECALCTFAFTTKANCERHIRNRHGKVTKEEVKNALIYHPSEDSSNTESLDRCSPRTERTRSGDEVRKSLVFSSEHEPTHLHHPSEIRVRDESNLRQPQIPVTHNASVNHYNQSDVLSIPPSMHSLNMSFRGSEKTDASREIINESLTKPEDDYDSRSSAGSVSLVSDTKVEHQRTQITPINLKKEPEQAPSNDDAPLDLSMDVLDLSKKSKEKKCELNGTIEEIDNKQTDEAYNSRNQLLLTQALLKARPSTSLESLYSSAQMFYRTYMETWGKPGTEGYHGGVLQPYIFNQHFLHQDYSLREKLQKDFVRGLQTSGGTLVEPVGGHSGYSVGGYQASRNISDPPMGESNDFPNLMSPKVSKMLPSREKMDTSSCSNSVKMVIKNGVLMPKQKQRRYRTERPFSCAHCSARFTLRSNMERHIKQQHPQYWSQRPRGGHTTRGRPPSHPPTMVPSVCSQSSQMSSRSSNHSQSSHAISDQVKYAILAQQLKSNKAEENESDEELIIDEEGVSQRRNTSDEKPEPTEKIISLLRGKLEENHDAAEQKLENNRNHLPEIKQEKEDDEDMAEQDDERSFPGSVKDESNYDSASESSNLRHASLAMRHSNDNNGEEVHIKREKSESEDLASVSELLDNASQQYQQFQPQYLSDEEGLIASTSDGNPSGSEDKSDSINSGNSANSSSSSKKKKKKKKKKKSAYSLAPNRVICPYCQRPFPWTSSLRRHILTHTGQKPYQCMHCSLLFTTKSNCDRHLMRKHKANPNKIRRVRNNSSPEPQEIAVNNNSFSMRNVPERPYKCNQCPSSTFSTVGNLKKHRTTKHSHSESGSKFRSESPSLETQNSPPECPKQNDQSGYESQSSGVSEPMETNATENVAEMVPEIILKNHVNLPNPIPEVVKSRKPSPGSSPAPADHPFKCHLCDSGFVERQECLDHIKDNHQNSYEMLVAKGALDMDIDGADEPQPPPMQNPSDGEEKRGRFPDYSNRKVVCAFCVRRFWSAEDLRRHMRTHTGERPFSCDICSRRFTLKHSMLRHRKKHETSSSPMYVGTSGDEDQTIPNQPATMVATAGTSRNQDRVSLPTVMAVATGDAAPSGLSLTFNPYERRATLTAASNHDQVMDNGKEVVKTRSEDGNSDSNGDTRMNTEKSPNTNLSQNSHENDLISNLLGLRDSSIVDKVLQASPDDAAIMLGVESCRD